MGLWGGPARPALGALRPSQAADGRTANPPARPRLPGRPRTQAGRPQPAALAYLRVAADAGFRQTRRPGNAVPPTGAAPPIGRGPPPSPRRPMASGNHEGVTRGRARACGVIAGRRWAPGAAGCQATLWSRAKRVFPQGSRDSKRTTPVRPRGLVSNRM